MTNKPTIDSNRSVLSLFSSAGIGELGIKASGMKILLSNELLPNRCSLYKENYPETIFVHGCFWHGHRGCTYYTVPKTNTDFWVAKVARNQERDQEVWRQLEAKGWEVIIVWECELKKTRFEETIERVEKEILANGELYRKRIEERLAARIQRLAERREQKARQALLLKELK